MELLQVCSLSNISLKISLGMKRFFHGLGIFISHNPFKTMGSVFLVVSCLSMGLLKFYEETNMVKLWIPEGTDFSRDYEWLIENYPPDVRFNSLILEDDENVLRPEVIKQMYKIHKSVEKVRTADGSTWQDVCMRLPIVSVDIDGAVQDGARPKPMSKGDVDNDFRSKRSVDVEVRSKRNVDEQSGDDAWGDFFESFDDLEIDDSEADLERKAIDEAFSKVVSIPKDESVNEFDPSVVFYPDQYCPVVERMRTGCYETSILEIFANAGSYDSTTDDVIETLTQQQIIDAINTVTLSGAFMINQNFHSFLGGILRNSTGHIIGAKSTYIRWFIKAKTDSIELTSGDDDSKGNMGLGLKVDPMTLAFEEKLLETLSDQSQYPEGLRSFANVQRSFGDLSSKAIWDDVRFLIVGYSLVFMYVQIMLGSFNLVEQRATLGLMALLCVGMGVITSFGICSLLGLAYGPMHSLIPCLLVGLGVDNAFVLVQEMDNVNRKEMAEHCSKKPKRDLHERFAEAIEHAGVGITITSTTDFIVFLVGGTTVLPSLRSYSFYTGIGIAATYFIQITFFTSCLYLDQKRIEEERDGVLCCCIRHENSKKNIFSRLNLMQNTFKYIGVTLQNAFVKVVVLLITLIVLAFGIYGTMQLKVKFDYIEFLPQDSGLYQWFSAQQRHFPDEGEMGVIYFAGFDLKSELPRIKELCNAFSSQNEYIFQFESWYLEFEEYVNKNFLPESTRLPDNADQLTDEFFREKLTQFLFSPRGAKFKEWFQFENHTQPICGQISPIIKMSSMKFMHPSFTGFSSHIEAMNWVKKTIQDLSFPGVTFAMSNAYARWEIDEVIAHELLRNLILAVVCVTITTLLMLANIKASLFVILCVLITLTDVAGFMYFWGLTIDIVAATNLIISVGLCVDFAAHLTHTFMKENGKLNDRLSGTMSSIGPAIFHGGVSTLLAVVILADSVSHVFQSYFKIFFLMVILGLFHGLIFLPVLLSLLGPEPYGNPDCRTEDTEENFVENQEFLIHKVVTNGKESIV